eukprot:6183390-Pleurochrysis_carterae.AAC.1
MGASGATSSPRAGWNRRLERAARGRVRHRAARRPSPPDARRNVTSRGARGSAVRRRQRRLRVRSGRGRRLANVGPRPRAPAGATASRKVALAARRGCREGAGLRRPTFPS